MRSLSLKIAGALLLMVVISVGLMAYFSNLSTTREFGAYLSQGNQRYQQNAAEALSLAFVRDGGWANVQSVLTGLLRSTSERLVVADKSGRVVGDTAGQWLDRAAPDVGLADGVSITVSGSGVGQLFTFLTQAGSTGRGYLGGGRGGPPTSTPVQANGEAVFLSRTNRSLLITGIVAGLFALAVGLVLTRLITRPVRALTYGARQITKGDLRYRVDVKSNDELGELGRSFNTMAAGLEEAEDGRKRIVADVAHELRTPLTIIEGTVDGIQDGVFEADSMRLGIIREQTALLTRLTSDLRDLSLAESGQLKLVLASTDLVDLVKRRTLQFQVPASNKGVRLELDLPHEEQRVDIDRTRVEQVLGNLLSNAIRHTPSGGSVKASLRTTKAADAGGLGMPGFVVSVADTGEGIAPEHLPHVFERFYRVQTSRSRSEGGAGIGLAIVKRMVEAHGGTVWVESQPGSGTIFSFTIPRRTSPE